MKIRSLVLPVAQFVLALNFIPPQPARAGLLFSSDTFGSGTNAFAIDFVGIGDTNNAADTTGYGSVPYEYRISTYEISQSAITKAVAGGMSPALMPLWTASQPAGNVNWYYAATFVNWLNTNSGYQAAYNLAYSGEANWSMTLWSSADAWTLGGTNLYRHKDAHYFLPSENEWYKAAYYNAGGVNYFLYPTASNTAPIAVVSGTNAGTAVYYTNNPAAVNLAGGTSPYGTVGQGGNIWEWIETAYDGENTSSSENRVLRGGSYASSDFLMQSSERGFGDPITSAGTFGFRVASVSEVPVVPEPGTWAIAALLAGGAALVQWRRRKQSGK